jgi:hypothetical protein
VIEPRECGAAGEKEFDGADVTVVGAVSNERDFFMNGVGGSAVREIFEDSVGAAGRQRFRRDKTQGRIVAR